jgi:membrane protein
MMNGTELPEREARRRSLATLSRASNFTKSKVDHGRSAAPHGLSDILRRASIALPENIGRSHSIGVTFYLLLSIFPGIAALISVYGLFADPATIANQLDIIADIAPGGAIRVLHDDMTRLASQGRATLGAGFLLGLVTSLWTENSGVSAIRKERKAQVP